MDFVRDCVAQAHSDSMTAHKNPVGKTMRAAGFCTVIGLVALIMVTAYKKGRESQTSASQSNVAANWPPQDHVLVPIDSIESGDILNFRVAGSSMHPTFMGPTVRVRCEKCGIGSVVDPSFEQVADRNRICANCGGQLVHEDEIAPTEADVVQIEKVDFTQSANTLRVGDVVAIRSATIEVRGSDSKPKIPVRLKRVAGVAGDTISVRNGRLLVNGKRLEDVLHEMRVTPKAQLWVNIDFPGNSRWSPSSESSGWQHLENPCGWRWSPDGSDKVDASEDWLVYHHQSVHDQNRSSEVYDDYPLNVGVTRKMNPVDRLAVYCIPVCRGEFTLQVVFWTKDGNVAVKVDTGDGQKTSGSWYNTQPIALPSSPPELSAQTPIAIRVVDPLPIKSFILDTMTVARFNEYRLRRGDDSSVYPLTLGQDECFVVGDNVPVSIDSRETGPVAYRDLIGRAVSQ